ncbi:MAG: alpha-galactosidase, partial [Promicromonosporaceae bacterium]|nr:alpha-galactosidase [Promicromonosporaceae bacterium]
EILLESCSSGGNRFDLGMLCHSPQIWASDDTDPIERLKIQGGLSYLYPPSTMGAHISQAPHQQTLRHTPLSTRFNVAAFGVLGYELDLKNVTRLEKKEIAEQIAWYKRHRNTLQFGRFSRLDTGRANQVAWQVVSPSSTIGEQKAIAGFFQTLASAYPGFDSLRVLGLDDDRRYRVETRPQHLYLDRFGELLKHITPIELKPDGAVLRLAGKFIKLTDAVERYEADGVLLASGLMLNSQFLGSNYTPETRLLGDFGSALYLIEETP